MLGDLIQARINEIGITQNDAAKLIGISRAQLGCYLSNKKVPGALMLKRIALALKVSTDELLEIHLEYEIDKKLLRQMSYLEKEDQGKILEYVEYLNWKKTK